MAIAPGVPRWRRAAGHTFFTAATERTGRMEQRKPPDLGERAGPLAVGRDRGSSRGEQARMELLTERLRLRPIGNGDIDELHRLWIDPDVRRYLADGRIVARDVVEAIVADSQKNFRERSFGFFAIFLRDAVELVGFCGLRVFEDGEQVELLYGVRPDHWGSGIANEAATEVLRYAFERVGVDRVIAATDTPNQRSVSVLQRLGMSFEARREFHGLDTVFYSMNADEFREHAEAQRELGL